MARILGPELAAVLRQTSRSFFLSLQMLPPETREPIGLAYLMARLADTVTDTASLPLAERTGWLTAFVRRLTDPSVDGHLQTAQRLAIGQQTEGERRLLELAPAAWAAYDRLEAGDRARTARVLATIAEGMLLDRSWFPDQDAARLRALAHRDDLDRYCYCVAGCVGEYWTQMHAAHLPDLRERAAGMTPLGVRFGKGLQLVNVLRDIPGDLRRGRCYLPAVQLERLALEPVDLLEPASLPSARPLLDELIDDALEHLDAGWTYLRQIPARRYRLRLACAWPLLVGIRTLGRLRRADDLLDPGRPVKVPRSEVYRLLAESSLRSASPAALARMWRRELESFSRAGR